MKVIELIAVWNKHRAPLPRSDIYLTRLMNGHGDDETGTSMELISLSERFERESLPFTPAPSTCTSCNGDANGDEVSADWVSGHRPRWWVCRQCHTVFPHRCDTPNESGHCWECGRKMNWDAILLHNLKEDRRRQKAAVVELESMFFGPPPSDVFPPLAGWESCSG